MAKVSNVMATKVALDMVEASTSIRNLTTIVNSATQAWKAQEAMQGLLRQSTKD